MKWAARPLKSCSTPATLVTAHKKASHIQNGHIKVLCETLAVLDRSPEAAAAEATCDASVSAGWGGEQTVTLGRSPRYDLGP